MIINKLCLHSDNLTVILELLSLMLVMIFEVS